MSARSELWTRLRALFRRNVVERELDDELRHHLEMEVDAGVRAGLSPEEARRRALVRFGGVERHKEAARDERGVRWLEEAWRDLRFALRSLRRSPAFTIAAVLTLALGIGANTAIFSVVDGVLVRPIPFRDAKSLYMIWETDRNSGTVREPAAYPDYEDFQWMSKQFSDMGALLATQATLTGSGMTPTRTDALWVTPSLLRLLGVKPLAGRLFTERDAKDGSALVFLGEAFWRARFGADPGVVGRTIQLYDRPFTVVGILPESAGFGFRQMLGRAAYAGGFAGDGRRSVDLWATMPLPPAYLERDTHPFFVVGRLAEGSSARAAATEMGRIAADLEARYRSNDARGTHVESYAQVVFSPVRPALLTLLAAVALVLLVACVNVANLLLARGTARARELAVRRALGAGGGRLAGQFLAESAVLTLLAAAAGVGLAYGGLGALRAMAPEELPRLEAVAVDGRVLLATVLVSALAALIFGMVPTLQARRLNVSNGLAAGRGAGGSGRRARSLRSALVVVEMALAVMLVSGAGLLMRSFWALVHTDPGFRVEGVLKAQFQLPLTRYPQNYREWPRWPRQEAFMRSILASLEATPGVESVALSAFNPLDRGNTNSFVVVGREEEGKDWPELPRRAVTPGYFATVGVPIVEGRGLRAGDDLEAPPVTVVNEAMVKRYFPDGSPIGHAIRMWGVNWRIVGVVADEHFYGLDQPAPPAAYMALAQSPLNSGSILVRTSGDPMALAGAVRRAVHDFDPQLAVFGVEPLSRTLSASVAGRRFTTLLLGLLAALALVLMAVGIHGVLSYTVAQRTGEMGIRMALGARRGAIVGMVVRQGLGLTVVGLALGLAGALAGTRLLASMLFKVPARDPLTLAAVAGVVLASALVATVAPARRATAADPMGALRSE
jgi:predicted permease